MPPFSQETMNKDIIVHRRQHRPMRSGLVARCLQARVGHHPFDGRMWDDEPRIHQADGKIQLSEVLGLYFKLQGQRSQTDQRNGTRGSVPLVRYQKGGLYRWYVLYHGTYDTISAVP
jgi:hypothetical protein